MIALELLEVKECMSKLLKSDIFHSFLFIEGSITTFNTFSIDGYLKKDFFDTQELELSISEREYSLWKDMKEICFSLIKGKKTPLDFKFVFGLSKENISKLLKQEGLSVQPEEVQGLYLNLRYDGQRLECITGSSLKIFTLDKSLDLAWDSMIQKFFKHHEITYEIL